MYVDDIIVTGNDVDEIRNLKRHLTSNFDIKSLGQLTYFLGIEVAYSKSGIVLSQHKYILDLLKDTANQQALLSTPILNSRLNRMTKITLLTRPHFRD